MRRRAAISGAVIGLFFGIVDHDAKATSQATWHPAGGSGQPTLGER